jgi:hypothetical protein
MSQQLEFNPNSYDALIAHMKAREETIDERHKVMSLKQDEIIKIIKSNSEANTALFNKHDERITKLEGWKVWLVGAAVGASAIVGFGFKVFGM